MPPGAPAFAATQLSGANLTLRESRSKDGATATGGPAGLWGRTPCTAPTGARAHTRQIASMKLISIKGIYVATLVYQLYRIQFAPSAPGRAASQAAGRLQARAPLAPRMLQRAGRVTRHGVLRSSLSGAASKARTPAILAPFLPGLKSTSQPDVNVPCRPYSSAEQCLCAAP